MSHPPRPTDEPQLLSRRAVLRAAGLSAGVLAASTVLPAGTAQALAAAAPQAVAAPEPWRIARVSAAGPRRAVLLANFDDTHNVFADGDVEILLWPGDLARLDQTGLRYEITVPDVMARDRALEADAVPRSQVPLRAQPGETTDATYRQLADFERDMRALVTRFPTQARLLALPNKTLVGRTVYGIEICDDVTREDGRPVFYNDGCHHAREWPAAEVPMMWAYDLLEATDARMLAIRANVRNIIVPVVNVDGFEYSRASPDSTQEDVAEETGLLGVGNGNAGYWRKNLRSFNSDSTGSSLTRDPSAYGVDNNRNYSFSWGDDQGGSSGSMTSQTYRGPAPLTEAENLNTTAIHKGRMCTAMISHHTSGDLILWAWGDTAADAPDNDLLEGLGRRMATLNTYVPQKNIDLYVTTGTASDYVYGITGSISYTFEHAGSSFHPPYAQTVPAMYARNREAMMILAEQMCLEPALRPSTPLPVPKSNGSDGVAPDIDPTRLNHCILVGRTTTVDGIPVQGRIRLTKTFKTLLWKEGDGTAPGGLREVTETIDVGIDTAPDGTFRWSVNPSTRPKQTAAGLTESYLMFSSSPDPRAPKTDTRSITIARGEIQQLGDVVLSDAAPPAVVPEVPLVAALPVAAALVGAGVWAAQRAGAAHDAAVPG